MRQWLWLLSFLLLPGCTAPLQNLLVQNAVLSVDIGYEGSFYTEVFGYARDAGNIQHVVLVMPEALYEPGDAGWIMTSLNVVDGEIVIDREDRQEYLWALPYVHLAPAGQLRRVFPPGNYFVAVGFLAGPIPQEDAPEGAVLWPGITGGGASTDYEPLQLEPGEERSLSYTLTDANGWACPWLYVFDGENYYRYSEILRYLKGPENQRTEHTPLPDGVVIDGVVQLRIIEEKDEISTLDQLYLLVDGKPVYATDNRLRFIDDDVIVMEKGDTLDLHFAVGDFGSEADIQVIATGYYIPCDPLTGCP
jgi:hypothetical protein